MAVRFPVALLALGLALGGNTGPADAESATVNVAANVVTPGLVSAEQAVMRLFSPTPGVLTITIPKPTVTSLMSSERDACSGADCSISLTATAASAASNVFTFTASSDNAAGLSRLLEQVRNSTQSQTLMNGTLTTALTMTGYIDGMGFQMVAVNVVQNRDGSGYVTFTIPYN